MTHLEETDPEPRGGEHRNLHQTFRHRKLQTTTQLTRRLRLHVAASFMEYWLKIRKTLQTLGCKLLVNSAIQETRVQDPNNNRDTTDSRLQLLGTALRSGLHLELHGDGWSRPRLLVHHRGDQLHFSTQAQLLVPREAPNPARPVKSSASLTISVIFKTRYKVRFACQPGLCHCKSRVISSFYSLYSGIASLKGSTPPQNVPERDRWAVNSADLSFQVNPRAQS